MSIDNYMDYEIRKLRACGIRPLTEADIKVWNQAGQEAEKYKQQFWEIFKLNYQNYMVSTAQKARYKTKNQGW